MPDPLPRRDYDLAMWLKNLAETLSEDPQRYAVPPERAAQLLALQQAFHEVFLKVNNRGTRTVSLTSRKDELRAELVREARLVSKTLRGNTEISEKMLIDVGLRRRKARRHVMPVPDDSPLVNLRATTGGFVRVSLRDRSNDTRKAKPKDCLGARLFSHIGPNPPSGNEKWQWIGVAKRTDTTLSFGVSHPPGTRVWVTAMWLNSTGAIPGPASDPTSILLDLNGAEVDLGVKKAA